MHKHRFGIDTWASLSESGAYGRLAEVCRERWADAVEIGRFLRPHRNVPVLPIAPPGDDRRVVELYFSVMREDDSMEFYEIREAELTE